MIGGHRAFGKTRDPVTTAAANRVADAFLAYFRELVTRRRSTPEDDLITSLLHAQGAGDGFLRTRICWVSLWLFLQPVTGQGSP